MIRQDIEIPVPQPGAPDEQDAVNFGQKLADFIIAHPMPFAVIVLTLIIASLWKNAKTRMVIIVVGALFAGAWLAGEGVL